MNTSDEAIGTAASPACVRSRQEAGQRQSETQDGQAQADRKVGLHPLLHPAQAEEIEAQVCGEKDEKRCGEEEVGLLGRGVQGEQAG